jgi:lipopolysaccharide transport system permease protein
MNFERNSSKFSPITITPATSLEMPNFREILEYKGLLFFLIRRDLMLRFQQTVIGFLWILFQPLIMMVIFSVVFGILIRVPTGDIPYTLFFLSAYIVWQFFTQIVNNSANSLVGNIGVILKSYFPRLILPLSTIASALIDFAVSFVVLMVFILIDGNYPITSRYLYLPILLLLTTLFASGVGMLFGALMVVFRDMKNLLTFIMMIWMYITPLIYPISIVPQEYQYIFYLNPLTSLIDAYRWVFLNQGELPEPGYLLISFIVASAIWFCGAVAFRAMENRIADVM